MGYEKLYTLPEDQYAKGAPILIKAGALLKNSDNGMILAQLKLQNISPKPVSFVKVSVFCKDAAGRDLETVEFEYLDLNAERDAMFGSQTPIRLGNRATRECTLQITEVGFLDKSIWQGKDTEWKPLGAQAPISTVIPEENALYAYQSTFGTGAAFLGQEHPEMGAWRCTCGRLNADTDARCYGCGAALSEILHPDAEALRREGIYQKALALIKEDRADALREAVALLETVQDYQDSAERIQTCRQRIEALTADSKKKKKLAIIISAISAAVAVPLIVLGILFAPYLSGNYGKHIRRFGITEFEIPDGVTSIENDAFYGCWGLTSITIPDSVTSIGDYAFRDCWGLGSITIGKGVTSIGPSAFSHCSGLTSIIIPDSVESIGDWAFSNCTSLTSITIPDSVTSIGEGAFAYCEGLTSITIPDSVTSIGDSAFHHCEGLESITIPDSVTNIGDCAFYYCTALDTIVYEGTVKRWKQISKGYDYLWRTPSALRVVCTDGIVDP